MKYVYQEYSSAYPAFFSVEKSHIASNISHSCEIEHIGSTAVSGLGGKPIIDILIMASAKELEGISCFLQKIGYLYRPQHSTPDHLFLKKECKGKDLYAYHIHLCARESKNAQAFIGLRDHLKANPKETQRYAEIKKAAAIEAKGGGLCYRQRKEQFFKSLDSKLRTHFN